jgi:hypothetical protein
VHRKADNGSVMHEIKQSEENKRMAREGIAILLKYRLLEKASLIR